MPNHGELYWYRYLGTAVVSIVGIPPEWDYRDTLVRVNNEKNGGVKKAPQARGGRPLRSINVFYPFVCHFHPLQLYVSRLPK